MICKILNDLDLGSPTKFYRSRARESDKQRILFPLNLGFHSIGFLSLPPESEPDLVLE